MLPTGKHNNGDFVPLIAARPALTIEDGGLCVHRKPTPEQLLDVAVQEIAASAKRGTNSKAYPGRSVADIAQGSRFPMRVAARIIAENLRGDGPVNFGERLGYALISYNALKARELGRETIDHEGAA